MVNEIAKFSIGQLVHHRLFDYRGGTDEWYEQVARSRPPKDKPWYRVLVHNAEHETYVAERNLEPDPSIEPINHPLVDQLFDRFENGVYSSKRHNH